MHTNSLFFQKICHEKAAIALENKVLLNTCLLVASGIVKIKIFYYNIFVVLFLAVCIFCVLAFMVGSSSKVKAFASQETEVVAVQEEATGKIELEIVEINANNKTFDGTTDVPVSIKIAKQSQ